MTGYTLIRAKRRTMSLQLDRDGNAVVRAPYGVKKEFIDRFVAEHEDWLTRAREKQQARRLAHPEPTDEERKALIARAKEYLPMCVDYWSGIMGLTPTGLKITSARTRFGSCSGKNSLCFSWRLKPSTMLSSTSSRTSATTTTPPRSTRSSSATCPTGASG